MERKSEYLANLTADAQGRYECKVISSGLNTDSYAIDDCYWTETPEIAPDVQWSDMMLYMTATPSLYTREAIEVKPNVIATEYCYYIYTQSSLIRTSDLRARPSTGQL